MKRYAVSIVLASTLSCSTNTNQRVESNDKSANTTAQPSTDSTGLTVPSAPFADGKPMMLSEGELKMLKNALPPSFPYGVGAILKEFAGWYTLAGKDITESGFDDSYRWLVGSMGLLARSEHTCTSPVEFRDWMKSKNVSGYMACWKDTAPPKGCVQSPVCGPNKICLVGCSANGANPFPMEALGGTETGLNLGARAIAIDVGSRACGSCNKVAAFSDGGNFAAICPVYAQASCGGGGTTGTGGTNTCGGNGGCGYQYCLFAAGADGMALSENAQMPVCPGTTSSSGGGGGTSGATAGSSGVSSGGSGGSGNSPCSTSATGGTGAGSGTTGYKYDDGGKLWIAQARSALAAATLENGGFAAAKAFFDSAYAAASALASEAQSAADAASAKAMEAQYGSYEATVQEMSAQERKAEAEREAAMAASMSAYYSSETSTTTSYTVTTMGSSSSASEPNSNAEPASNVRRVK